MAESEKTTPSRATRDEEARDAQVRAGVDKTDDTTLPATDPGLDPEVAEHYEEMTERDARQRGEGRLP